VYAECDRFGDDSYAFAARVLNEAGVAITPGGDFGDNGADRHVRFSYTTGTDQIEEGLARLSRLLR
jgi:aspartate/methionine/tyrosine aminotransferase